MPVLGGLAPAEYTNPLVLVLREISTKHNRDGESCARGKRCASSHDVLVDRVEAARETAELYAREVDACEGPDVVSSKLVSTANLRTIVGLDTPVHNVALRRVERGMEDGDCGRGMLV